MKDAFKIEKLDHFGRGISYSDGKIVFIENALPEEVVEMKETKEKENFKEGEASRIIEKSKDRKNPECPYYHECGGCDVMHLEYRKQLEWKEQKVKELLGKFAGIPFSTIQEIIPSIDFFYRNKITLKVKEGLGLYRKKSYQVVPIEKCVICSEKINEIIRQLETMKLSSLKEIIIRDSYDSKAMVILISDDVIDDEYYTKVLKNLVSTIVIKEKEEYRVVYGDGYIVDKIGDCYFKVSPSSFFQVNRICVEKLYQQIEKYANLKGQETVLDLYCGTGTIGIFLSKNAKRVIGVERNKDAVSDAFENKKLNHITNIEYVCNDAAKEAEHIKSSGIDVDLVVIDPPRSGLSESALNNILKISPKKIIYTSCDPATLSRDLNILQEKYQVIEVTPVDMFPNTRHVECVCVLNIL